MDKEVIFSTTKVASGCLQKLSSTLLVKKPKRGGLKNSEQNEILMVSVGEFNPKNLNCIPPKTCASRCSLSRLSSCVSNHQHMPQIEGLEWHKNATQMGCSRNIVNRRGLKVNTAKHSSEKGEGGTHLDMPVTN